MAIFADLIKMKQICFTHHSDHYCLFVIFKTEIGYHNLDILCWNSYFWQNWKPYYPNADTLQEAQFFLLNILALFCHKRILSQKKYLSFGYLLLKNYYFTTIYVCKITTASFFSSKFTWIKLHNSHFGTCSKKKLWKTLAQNYGRT